MSIGEIVPLVRITDLNFSNTGAIAILASKQTNWSVGSTIEDLSA
jgi:hypothetical protein